MHDRESTTKTSTPLEAPGLPIDVLINVDETASGPKLRVDGDNPSIGPDYITYTLTQAERLVRFTIRPRNTSATVTTVVTSAHPPDPNLLPDGPYVLALDAEVDIAITYTPAAQQGKPKPKPKDFSVTLRVRPPGGPLS